MSARQELEPPPADVVQRWHSTKAVLLLLSEEMQQMRNFIDNLRVSRITRNIHDDGSEAADGERHGWRGPTGLEDVDKALRLVCDRLDALVIVCDAVLDDDGAAEWCSEADVERCSTGGSTDVIDDAEPGWTSVKDLTADADCLQLRCESRQVFDHVVETIERPHAVNRPLFEQSGVVTHNRCVQTPQSTQRHHPAFQHDADAVDADNFSEGTEANSSHGSSYATCDAFFSGSTSPGVRLPPAFEEMSTDFTSKSGAGQPFGDREDRESVATDNEKFLALDARDRIDEDMCMEQTRGNAMQPIVDEETLLERQQRSNVMLLHELVRLSEQNRALQNTVAELRDRLDRKDSEIATLTNKADRLSRMLDEQVEEFRCVFRAVSRDNDERLDRLFSENDQLKCALTSVDSRDGAREVGTTESAALEHSRGVTLIRDELASDAAKQWNKESASLNKAMKHRVSAQTADQVSFPQRNNIVSSNGELDKCVQGRQSPTDSRGSSVHRAEGPWSETDVMEKAGQQQGGRFVASGEERQCVIPTGNWNDAGAITERPYSQRELDAPEVDSTNSPSSETSHFLRCDGDVRTAATEIEGRVTYADSGNAEAKPELCGLEISDQTYRTYSDKSSVSCDDQKSAEQIGNLTVEAFHGDERSAFAKPTTASRNVKTIHSIWQNSGADNDRISVDLETSFVPRSFERRTCATLKYSGSRSLSAFSPSVFWLPGARTSAPSSLSDLVLQIQQQNATLASCVTAMNSCFDRCHLDDGGDSSRQLGTTVFAESGVGSNVEQRKTAETATLSFMSSSPFTALSAVCLERPLVVDLTTIAGTAGSEF